MSWYDFCLMSGIGLICGTICKILWYFHLENDDMGNTTPSRIFMILAIIFAIPGLFVVIIDSCIYSFLYIHRTVSFAKSEVRLALEEQDELHKVSIEREYDRGYRDAEEKYQNEIALLNCLLDRSSEEEEGDNVELEYSTEQIVCSIEYALSAYAAIHTIETCDPSISLDDFCSKINNIKKDARVRNSKSFPYVMYKTMLALYSQHNRVVEEYPYISSLYSTENLKDSHKKYTAYITNRVVNPYYDSLHKSLIEKSFT